VCSFLLTFGLAIVAQEGRVNNDAVERALELSRQLERLLEVIVHEFFKNRKTLIDLEQLDLRPAFVFSRRLHTISLIAVEKLTDVTYQQILKLNERARCTHDGDSRLVRGSIEQLPRQHLRSLIAVPELTHIPVLGESIHGKLPVEVIFSLRLQLLKLVLSCIALAVKFFQRGKSVARQLSSLLSTKPELILSNIRHFIV
jgi:hypothetical protein